MKFLQILTFYENSLRDFYARGPQFGEAGFDEQRSQNQLMKSLRILLHVKEQVNRGHVVSSNADRFRQRATLPEVCVPAGIALQ